MTLAELGNDLEAVGGPFFWLDDAGASFSV